MGSTAHDVPRVESPVHFRSPSLLHSNRSSARDRSSFRVLYDGESITAQSIWRSLCSPADDVSFTAAAVVRSSGCWGPTCAGKTTTIGLAFGGLLYAWTPVQKTRNVRRALGKDARVRDGCCCTECRSGVVFRRKDVRCPMDFARRPKPLHIGAGPRNWRSPPFSGERSREVLELTGRLCDEIPRATAPR